VSRVFPWVRTERQIEMGKLIVAFDANVNVRTNQASFSQQVCITIMYLLALHSSFVMFIATTRVTPS